MKWGVCLVVVAAVLAAPATASAPTLTSLQRQITGLRTQVAALQTREGQLEKRTTGLSDLATCQTALQQDNINATWHVLNLLAQYDGFQPQPDLPRYDDKGSCARVGVTR